MVYIHVHRNCGTSKQNGILENALKEVMQDDVLDELQSELEEDDDDDPDFYFPNCELPMPCKPLNE